MNYLMWVDPGKSTGVALFEYGEERPAELVKAWQFDGGLSGFLGWWRDHTYEHVEGTEVFLMHDDWRAFLDELAYVPGEIGEVYGDDWHTFMRAGSEKFTPLQNRGFSLTQDSVEPLRIEGAMVALGIIPEYTPGSPLWQRPSEMYWVPGRNAAEKRKNQVAWVKERFPELHLTGKDVGAPDADDARSALWHGMVYLRKTHLPSALNWFGESDEHRRRCD